MRRSSRLPLVEPVPRSAFERVAQVVKQVFRRLDAHREAATGRPEPARRGPRCWRGARSGFPPRPATSPVSRAGPSPPRKRRPRVHPGREWRACRRSRRASAAVRLLAGEVGQSGIEDMGDAGMGRKLLRQRQGALRLPANPWKKGAQAALEQPGLERSEHAAILRLRLPDARPVVVLARAGQGAGHDIGMAVQIFGCRMHDEVRPE